MLIDFPHSSVIRVPVRGERSAVTQLDSRLVRQRCTMSGRTATWRQVTACSAAQPQLHVHTLTLTSLSCVVSPRERDGWVCLGARTNTVRSKTTRMGTGSVRTRERAMERADRALADYAAQSLQTTVDALRRLVMRPRDAASGEARLRTRHDRPVACAVAERQNRRMRARDRSLEKLTDSSAQV
eukprot:2051361-Prymnesium_polylepis.1